MSLEMKLELTKSGRYALWACTFVSVLAFAMYAFGTAIDVGVQKRKAEYATAAERCLEVDGRDFNGCKLQELFKIRGH